MSARAAVSSKSSLSKASIALKAMAFDAVKMSQKLCVLASWVYGFTQVAHAIVEVAHAWHCRGATLICRMRIACSGRAFQ